MCVAFGSYSASATIDKNNRVVTRLRKKVYHFYTFIYCVAYKLNLTAIFVTKVPSCKELPGEVSSHEFSNNAFSKVVQ